MNPLKLLLEKPWYAESAPAMQQDERSAAPERVALRFFLGVIAVMFGLFMVAYYIRMELPDWRPMPLPSQLWLNTLVLILSSIALQWTRQRSRRGTVRELGIGMLLGGALTLLFIILQLALWRQLHAGGYILYNNPANSFFYVLTGIHALHLLGGLWVWLRASTRLWRGGSLKDVVLSIELCSVYWHFLLLVWLVLFALLSYT